MTGRVVSWPVAEPAPGRLWAEEASPRHATPELLNRWEQEFVVTDMYMKDMKYPYITIR